MGIKEALSWSESILESWERFSRKSEKFVLGWLQLQQLDIQFVEEESVLYTHLRVAW